MNKIVIVFLLAIMMTGCNSIRKKAPDVVINDFVIVEPEKVPEPKVDNIKYQVWNRDRLYTESQKEENKDNVFIILTQSELDKLFSNLINISDSLSKSIKNNNYYQNAINDYRNSKDSK